MPRESSIKEIAKNKPILDSRKQRVIWARVSAIKRILVKANLTTHEEFEEMVGAMVIDIDQKVEQKLREEVGADEGESG